ncbi:hypothetical protein [Lacticaseibacillus paracasei]|jgi:hypothetical protein|uniref:hypothetical protein n=1 Tax=Lacticaseibacillus paracasei TaxID=1597 RepID=UPI000298657E|nr:hypothetical protein [Lacticaseibacillus paracasei]EKQ24228.1 hypothetical protein LCAUW4_0379 [Lacticaseibacillus casei UW4]OUC65579.1 hypothetical protein BLL69_2909 [Lacticaseibacillus paracasei]
MTKKYVVEVIPSWYLAPIDKSYMWDDFYTSDLLGETMISEIEMTQDMTKAQFFDGKNDPFLEAILPSFPEVKVKPVSLRLLNG